MRKQAIVLFGLITMVLTNNETITTTTTSFVPIGSNEKLTTIIAQANTTIGGVNESVSINSAVVHPVNAQARKIEMTKLSSAGDVTASLKNQVPGGTGSSFVISPTMIGIMAALILVVIVSVIIGTAMFIMRRRFSIWRLNNSKQNLNGGGSNNGDGCESSSGTSEKTTPSSSATSPGGVNAVVIEEENQMTSVENKNAVVNIENETAETKEVGTTIEAVTNNQDKYEKTSEQEHEKSEHATQDVSSQSLIVNVLNELSESVANKLEAKSPSTRSIKSGQQASITDSDPDKQPLNSNSEVVQ